MTEPTLKQMGESFAPSHPTNEYYEQELVNENEEYPKGNLFAILVLIGMIISIFVIGFIFVVGFFYTFNALINLIAK